MINGYAQKVIRLVYEKIELPNDKRELKFSLTVSEMSEGVKELLGDIPHFDPTVSKPERKHIASIVDALTRANLAGGVYHEEVSAITYKVDIKIKQTPDRIGKQFVAAESLPSTSSP